MSAAPSRPAPGAGERTTPWLPAQHAAMVELATAAVFPCLLVGTLLAQQPQAVLVSVGQAILWLSVAAAIEVALVLHGAGHVVLVAFGLAVALRITRGNSANATLPYELALGWLYAVAGAAVLRHRPEVLQRQMRAFLVLSIPLMVLQIYGWPEWVYLLRPAEPGAVTTIQPAFLEQEGAFPALQARPSGMLPSNALLSLMVGFILVLVLAERRRRTLSLADGALVTVVVLASAKILYLIFLILSAIGLAAGPRERRQRIVKLWVLLGVVLGLFYLLFPGVVAYNLSPSRALFNYAIRVADFSAAFHGLPATEVTVQGYDGLEFASGEIVAGSQSGYAKFARLVPVLAVIALLLAPFHVARLRALRRTRPDLADIARNGLVYLGLIPLITSFIGAPLLSFAAGAAALPWLTTTAPRSVTPVQPAEGVVNDASR